MMSRELMELVLPRLAKRLNRHLRRYREGELNESQFSRRFELLLQQQYAWLANKGIPEVDAAVAVHGAVLVLSGPGLRAEAEEQSVPLEVVEYREGGENATVRKLPGRVSYPDIVLKWGVTDSQELYQWHLQVIRGSLARKDGSVVLLDSQGNEKLRWNFFNAWPSKWTGPTLNAKGNDVAIEELTLTCERQEQAT